MYAEYGSKVGYNTYSCMRNEKAICGIIQDSALLIKQDARQQQLFDTPFLENPVNPLKAVYGGKEEGGCGGACCRGSRGFLLPQSEMPALTTY